MHDIKKIKTNPQYFDEGLKRRGLDHLSEKILNLDERKRSLQKYLQDKQNQRNDLSKSIGIAKSEGREEEATKLLGNVADLKKDINNYEEKERKVIKEINDFVSAIPNIPNNEVPDGLTDKDNVILRTVGKKNNFNFDVQDHVELGLNLGFMDFDITSNISGARFVTLTGKLAQLERAIGTFMLDVHIKEHGYTEVSPPLLVKDQAAFGVGQLPKFSDDLFQTTTNMWLISTGEVPLTNLVRDRIHDIESLPLRYTALTPCFRSEAGAAGKDTRGMLRMHQFYKVEIVSIVHPDESKSEHERLTNCAESILKRLNLPYRVVSLCAGDLGFSAEKTYDLEVWLPSQNLYREISSCSLFGDFQARRMNSRFRSKNGKSIDFVHTLNGSGLAVGRTMLAILENFQDSDGSIIIPEALIPYMDGLKKIQASE